MTFFEMLSEQERTSGFTSGKTVYFDFSSQEHFDKVFKLFHSLYPLSQEMLNDLPSYLNTRAPKRVTEADWLKSYPTFNPDFVAELSRFAPENALSYALNMHKPGPGLSGLASYSQSKSAQINYVVKEINYYFSNNQLAIAAPHEPGKLPPLKKGYYITSLHYSPEQKKIQKGANEYYQADDFHFMVQNNDGLFSQRRGDKNPPERVDSHGNSIISPESAILFYPTDGIYSDYSSKSCIKRQVCVSYQFIGYIYFQTNETRLGLSDAGLELLDDLAEKAKVKPAAQTKLSEFKGRFFMYPPIPEFFADAREQIERIGSMTAYL